MLNKKDYLTPDCRSFRVFMPETLLAGSFGTEELNISPDDPWAEEEN